MKTWAYDEPNRDGSNHHVEMSEDEIIKEYWTYWSNAMALRGRHKCKITRQSCIDDWVITNWAYNVKGNSDD